MADTNMAALLQDIELLLASIVEARDIYARTGEYPSPDDGGPGDDQGFDDWAADVAEAALELLSGAKMHPLGGWE